VGIEYAAKKKTGGERLKNLFLDSEKKGWRGPGSKDVRICLAWVAWKFLSVKKNKKTILVPGAKDGAKEKRTIPSRPCELITNH